MSPTASPAAVVALAPATVSGVRLASPVAAGSSVPGAGLRHGLSRVLQVLGGFGEILIVAYAFPLAILAIGMPIALFVRLGLQAARALWRL